MVRQNELACFMLIGGEVLSTPDSINHWAVGLAYHHMWGNPVETPANQPLPGGFHYGLELERNPIILSIGICIEGPKFFLPL